MADVGEGERCLGLGLLLYQVEMHPMRMLFEAEEKK